MVPKPHFYFFDFFRGVGFGSEVNNLLYAIYYFNKHGIEYGVVSKNWASGFDRGWQDYFTSTLPSVKIRFAGDAYMLAVHELDYRFRKILSQKNYIRIRYRILALLFTAVPQHRYIVRPKGNFWVMRKYVTTQRNNNFDVFLATMHTLITELWQPVARICPLIESMRPKGAYITVHIRRGDKVTSGEDRLYELEEYVSAIQCIPGEVRNLFVMSDDVRVIQAMQKRMPEYNILYNSALSQHGYNQEQFGLSARSEVMTATDLLIAELEIARCSAMFVGTYGSNVFRLVEYLRGSRCIDISGVDRKQVDP